MDSTAHDVRRLALAHVGHDLLPEYFPRRVACAYTVHAPVTHTPETRQTLVSLSTLQILYPVLGRFVL